MVDTGVTASRDSFTPVIDRGGSAASSFHSLLGRRALLGENVRVRATPTSRRGSERAPSASVQQSLRIASA